MYAVKTLREVGVLKWHRDGCYAVAFAEVEGEGAAESGGETVGVSESREIVKSGSTNALELGMGPGPGSALDAIRRARAVKAQNTHWLAAGGKDGKTSLWDVF